ncbi:bifunctional DNA primase/polymerase [Streptomyces sp. A7024]|uniref:Bifunctional DNA primase/polymerase n=1 Tax=Streptomyces coryli TaxID=1128680 RepID=A0A6G4TYB2_9ACTN|nr:bifunctional DNA primase/polymerase [Streptomyces coryli]NGN64108.1 bifunctional DNA primase/polymerase [Streptomyces coryli]
MTHPPVSAQLAAALDAARRGWPVFPLRPGTKRPALHGKDRCPRTGPCTAVHATWEQRATTDPELIRRTWQSEAFNVGIATGPAGLVVIDLDLPKNRKDEKDAPSGATSFAALCERTGQPAPATFTLRTASGGQHRYFTTPPGLRLGNTAGKLAARIDTRAWGGYVVAPGSVVDGRAYEVTDLTPPVPLPAWLRAALAPAPRPTGVVAMPQPGNAPRYVLAALRSEVHNVATAPDGARNATLLRAARALGRFIAAGDLSRAEAEQALSGAAAANATQPQRYYDDVIARGLDWSIAHNPRGRQTA